MEVMVVNDELISLVQSRESDLKTIESGMAKLWWEQGRDISRLQDEMDVSGRKIADIIGINEISIRRYKKIFNSEALSYVLSDSATHGSQLQLTRRVCEELIKLPYDKAVKAMEDGAMPAKEKVIKAKEDWDEDEEKEEVQPKNLQDALEQNRKYRLENAELKKRNKELEHKLKQFDLFGSMESASARLHYILSELAFKNERENDISNKLGSDVVSSLRELKLSSSSIPTVKELKRAYKDEAKSNHPDKGGSLEDFQKIKEAYDCVLLKIKDKKDGK